MEILHHVAGLYHSFSHIKHTLGTAHDEMATSSFERATETVEFLRHKLPEHLARPRVAIVCGSGLGGLAKTVNPGTEEWQYKDVPNFPLSTGESAQRLIKAEVAIRKMNKRSETELY